MEILNLSGAFEGLLTLRALLSSMRLQRNEGYFVGKIQMSVAGVLGANGQTEPVQKTLTTEASGRYRIEFKANKIVGQFSIVSSEKKNPKTQLWSVLKMFEKEVY